MSRFAGKVAIVTGGAKGIGRAVCERLAAEGAGVAFNYRSSANEAEELVREIEAEGGQVLAFKADGTRSAELQAFFEAVDKRFGRLDILVNNAGISSLFGTDGSLGSITEEQYDKAFNNNVKSVFLATQQAVKRLGRGGSIVNIVSTSGDYPNANMTLYTASKFAPRAFTQVWAKEFGPRGIRVNAVSSGALDVGMTEGATPATIAWLKTTTPFNRLGTGAEIAAIVAFLCSEDASWISGEIVHANGAGTS
jgi:3-oxoacyl-[acyl-carrier protein] reductase